MTNLFPCRSDYGGVVRVMQWTDAENRLAIVKRSTDAAWLDQVRRADDVQVSVREAAGRRLRKLAKLTPRREDAKASSVNAKLTDSRRE